MKTSEKLRKIANQIDEVDNLPLEERNKAYSILLDEVRAIVYSETIELDLTSGFIKSEN